MAPHSLPYFESALYARTTFIEPFRSGWSEIPIEKLRELRDYLLEYRQQFQEAINDDLKSGGFATDSVSNIYQSLKKYTRWYDKNMVSINDGLARSDNKAHIAKEVLLIIEIVWTRPMTKYPHINENNQIDEFLTADERMKLYNRNKEDEDRKAERECFMVHLKGKSESEKQRKFDILAERLNGKKGKYVNIYLTAALRLEWLASFPRFDLMKKYWGIQGSQSGISNRNEMEDEALIESAIEELRCKLGN